MHTFKRAVLALSFGVMVLAAGCQTNPVAEAKTVQGKVGATLWEFTIAQNAADKIAADTAVPTNIRKAVVDAEIAAKPAADQLDQALRAYQDVAAQFSSGTAGTSQEQVLLRLKELNAALTAFVPLLSDMKKANARSKP